VLVAAHDLAPGTTLTASDLRAVRLPTPLVPPSALRPGARATGRALAVAVPAGLPVTTAALDVGRVLPPGTVATPVRLADPGETALLVVGDRVDVLAAPTDPTGTSGPGAGAPDADGSTTGPAAAGAAPTVVAADVPVLALPSAAADSGDQGGLVVVATTSVQAELLAGAASADRLSVVLQAH
jgi:Flp pilus assembly protein CpaB